MDLLLYLVVILVSSAVVWKGGSLLESSSKALSQHYNLPPVVQGSIIMAVGSSFPELSATVISTLIHGKFDLGVSAIIGSAIFNILVIPGVSVLVAGKMAADKLLIYKDAQFYITSVAVLLLTFSLAVIYYPVEGVEFTGRVTRPIALIPILLYGLYIFLQTQETRDFRSSNKNQKVHKIVKEWGKLFLSLVLILASVEGLVRSAIFLGEYFNTPDFLWGVTVVAIATSVPDAYVSVKVAAKGDAEVSLSNVLGSNIFDLLIAVPVGVIIAGSAEVSFYIAVPLMLFLTLATVLLITFLRRKLAMRRIEGFFLLGLYFLFVVWMVLESTGTLSFVISN